MKLLSSLFVALAATIVSVGTVQAHHSFSMFDKQTELVKTGTVVRWAFNNPHSWLYVNVKNKDGSETLWSFEGSAVPSLIQKGVTGSTFVPGDTVTFMYCPLKDGRPGGAIGWAKLKDGTFVSPADGGCAGNEAAITRWKEWMSKGYMSNKDAEAASH